MQSVNPNSLNHKNYKSKNVSEISILIIDYYYHFKMLLSNVIKKRKD